MLKALKMPQIKNLDINDPQRSTLLRNIIKAKPYLKNIYEKWYSFILQQIPQGRGQILEVGSGAGFFKEFFPSAILSDIMHCQEMDLVCSAEKIPLQKNSLKAIVMVNVFHHIPDVSEFLHECEHCLRPGGRVIMIEPWPSKLGKIIYSWFHHEPFTPDTSTWQFSSSGPLSGANLALPWIVFQRDREKFLELFPKFIIRCIRPEANFRYLISGGVSFRTLLPGWTYPAIKAAEQCLPFYLISKTALFAEIVIQKKSLQNVGE